MCHDYITAHRKFQAARYKSSYGIFHIRKHLTESQIVKYLFKILVSDVMAYNNVFLPPDLIFVRGGGSRVNLRTRLLYNFPRGQYPPNIYLSCQWFSHNLYLLSRHCTRFRFMRTFSFLPQPLFQSLFYLFNGTPALRSTHLLSFTYLKIRNRIANVCASRSIGVAQNIILRKPRSIFISLRSRSISFAVDLSCSLTSAKVSFTCLSA